MEVMSDRTWVVVPHCPRWALSGAERPQPLLMSGMVMWRGVCVPLVPAADLETVGCEVWEELFVVVAWVFGMSIVVCEMIGHALQWSLNPCTKRMRPLGGPAGCSALACGSPRGVAVIDLPCLGVDLETIVELVLSFHD